MPGLLDHSTHFVREHVGIDGVRVGSDHERESDVERSGPLAQISNNHRTDESANLNGDRVFVSHTPNPSGASACCC